MVMLVVGKESADYIPYQKDEQESIMGDPFGNVTDPIPHSDMTFKQTMTNLFKPWDKTTALARQEAGTLKGWDKFDKQGRPAIGNLKNQGKGLQYDYFDVYFHPSEVDTDEKKARAFEAVKEWAAVGNAVDGFKGNRAFEIQNWHLDGQNQMPHLRVTTSRVIYAGTLDNHRLAGPMARAENSPKNDDNNRLGVILEKYGFPGMKIAARGESGQIINPDFSPVSRRDTEAVMEGVDVMLDATKPKEASADEPSAAQDETTSIDGQGAARMTQATASRADLLQAAMQAEADKARIARENYYRFQAALNAENDAARKEAENNVLRSERTELNNTIRVFAESVRTGLADRDPAFVAATQNLAPIEVVRQGLEKHAEVEKSLQEELDAKLADLDTEIKKVQTLEETQRNMEAELEVAIGHFFDADEQEEYSDASLPEKVEYLGGKRREAESSASKLREQEREWLATNADLTKTLGETKEELTATTADRDAKAAELTKAQADINDAIALLRAAQPDLFKNNPTMENNIRASMEAALGKAAEEKDAREKLETQLKQANEANTALSEENQGLKTSLQTMQEERDTARQALETANQKLEEMTKTVERLTKVESNIERLLQPRVEGWASMSREDALDSLGKKFDEISQQKTTALSQVDFYKEQVETLNKKVDRLDERLDEQRREMQAQLTQQQQAHTQQIAQLIQNQQNQAAQGNVPTQSTGQPRTQENQNNQPSQSGGKGKSVDDPEI